VIPGERQWVADRLPISFEVRETTPDLGPIGLAVRDNPKRTQLLVTHALAKHVPAHPAVAFRAARALAERIRGVLPSGSGGLVVGMAETATGLAELVASELGEVDFLHTTRSPSPGSAVQAVFSESHSHAPSHFVAPREPGMLAGAGPLVIIDDELTTGRTVRQLRDALRKRRTDQRAVVASLLDARTEDADDTDIDVCALARVSVEVGPTAREIGRELARTLQPPRAVVPGNGRSRVLAVNEPVKSGRDGLRPEHLRQREAQAGRIADLIAGALGSGLEGVPIHLLGIEEQIALPVRIAAALAERTAATIRVSSTTRSPALVVDDPGYPLRAATTFGVAGAERRAYNTPNGAAWTIIVPDSDGLVDPGLLLQLPGDSLVLRWAGA